MLDYRQQQVSIIIKEEKISLEFMNTDQMLLLSCDAKKKFKTEIGKLILRAFPKISEKYWEIIVSDYFKRPGKKLQRQVILLRNESDRLIASTIFDCGQVLYKDDFIEAVYLLIRAVLPEYQGLGLGKTIAEKVLAGLQPDVLFTTCAQSSSLHSWVKLQKYNLIPAYEVYPRFEHENEEDILITVPHKDLDFAINVFRQIYHGVVEGKKEDIDKAIRNLTVLMVRKNLYGEMYNFNQWEKNGKEDKLAKVLGARNKDGVLVMFRKKY